MLKNYFKIALRNVKRQKGYTAINVMGLALGLACCLLIGLYIHDELSYDGFHPHVDQLYRIDEEIDNGGTTRRWAYLSVPHAPALQAEIPEIEQAVRFFTRSFVLGTDQVKLDGIRIAYVDPAALSMFSFPVQEGDTASMLDNPDAIVLTAETRARLFGNSPAVGQTVIKENEKTFRVSGVIERPANSHFSFDALVPFSTALVDYAWLDQWRASTTNTYVRLQPGVTPNALTGKLDAFLKAHHGANAEGRQLHLHALPDIRLRPATTGSTGTLGIIYLFAAIGVLVLSIACINYINLATARAADRFKEIGMRKVLGASRGHLILQLLGESIATVGIELLFALLIAEWTLPFVNNLTDKTLSLATLWRMPVIGMLLVVVTSIGTLAGLYPALYLARFRPSRILKSQRIKPKGSPLLRRSLVVVQFAVSIVLIVGTLLIRQQLDYLNARNLGFSGEQVISITQQDTDGETTRTLKQALLRLPEVVSVGRSSAQPGAIGWVMSIAAADALDETTPTPLVDFLLADADYLSTMGMTLKAGRNFSEERATDAQNAIIINEATARVLGFGTPEEALGQRYDVAQYRDAEIIGVVENFNYASLREEVKALVIAYDPDNTGLLAVKIRPDDVPGTIAALQAEWDRMLPAWPFVYSFVDEDFAALYRSEERLVRLFGAFTIFALLIAGLGLIGLAAFMTRQRTKEIGIRKVLGASVHNITLLVSREFALLVGVAAFLAWPLAYLGMNRWLEAFAYRIDISWPIFLIAGLAALGVAVLAVSYPAIRAATTNPVESLRYE